jgi:Leucine-rich repeat (LRR) protein
VKSLTGLENLSLANNPRIDNATVRSLTNLTALNLKLNTVITTAPKALPRLTELNLERNGMVMDACLKACTGLTSLSLKENICITNSGISILIYFVFGSFLIPRSLVLSKSN